jgi:hypothetical protein
VAEPRQLARQKCAVAQASMPTQARRQRVKEAASAEVASNDHPLGLVNAVNLEDVFGGIKTDHTSAAEFYLH